ncbi:MAG: RNA-binding protein [Planctomycetota bacterium]
MINIYIGNLPYDTTAEDLTQLFEGFGTVEKSALVFDRETGRSRGFGFVEMPEPEAARKAIDKLAGESFRGRPLTINEARPRGSGNSRGAYVSAAKPPVVAAAGHNGGSGQDAGYARNGYAVAAEQPGFIPTEDEDGPTDRPAPSRSAEQADTAAQTAPSNRGYRNVLLDADD